MIEMATIIALTIALAVAIAALAITTARLSRHNPMADGMLTALHKRRQIEQAIKSELDKLLGQ